MYICIYRTQVGSATCGKPMGIHFRAPLCFHLLLGLCRSTHIHTHTHAHAHAHAHARTHTHTTNAPNPPNPPYPPPIHRLPILLRTTDPPPTLPVLPRVTCPHTGGECSIAPRVHGRRDAFGRSKAQSTRRFSREGFR